MTTLVAIAEPGRARRGEPRPTSLVLSALLHTLVVLLQVGERIVAGGDEMTDVEVDPEVAGHLHCRVETLGLPVTAIHPPNFKEDLRTLNSPWEGRGGPMAS